MPNQDQVERKKVAVLGAGSWGTALAKSLSDQGHRVDLHARREELVRAMQENRENATYLPGFRFADTLRAVSSLEECVSDADLILVVIPTHGVRAALEEALPFFPKDVPILSATKGIEMGSLELVSGVFEQVVPKEEHRRLTYLGGPSFAKEVAAGMPTAVVVAGHDPNVTSFVQRILACDRLRVYTTEDVIGVEVGGALKNVMAIAAGVSDGMGFGHNTRAAIITRGLAEMARLATHLGANPLTLAGLGGMGDLVLTCTGDLSRNRRVGIELGQGKKLPEILAGMNNQVAEGVRTTQSAHDLAHKLKVDMPLVHAMHRVLYEEQDARLVVSELMGRPHKSERG